MCHFEYTKAPYDDSGVKTCGNQMLSRIRNNLLKNAGDQGLFLPTGTNDFSFLPAPRRLDRCGLRLLQRARALNDIEIRAQADRRRLALARLPAAHRRPIHICGFVRSRGRPTRKRLRLLRRALQPRRRRGRLARPGRRRRRHASARSCDRVQGCRDPAAGAAGVFVFFTPRRAFVCERYPCLRPVARKDALATKRVVESAGVLFRTHAVARSLRSEKLQRERRVVAYAAFGGRFARSVISQALYPVPWSVPDW